LTLYLYRYRLAQGPKETDQCDHLEEAHNLLLKKSTESKESVLETSIRMVRQYGSAMSLLTIGVAAEQSGVRESYATLALSQKLRSDVQAIAGAMNLSDEQKEALNTLAIVRGRSASG